MPEQQSRPLDIAALVASIERHHARALRLEQQIHEWAIVAREVIIQSRELLIAVEQTLRGAVRARSRRGVRAPSDLSARARPAAEEPRR